MHARIGTLHVHAQHFDRVIRMLRDTIMPSAQRQPGFSTFLVMGDREEGKVVGISLWETELDMLASESAEYLQDQVSRVIPFLRGPAEFEHYEVVALS
jgi:quinol monooxygenase YgiN